MALVVLAACSGSSRTASTTAAPSTTTTTTTSTTTAPATTSSTSTPTTSTTTTTTTPTTAAGLPRRCTVADLRVTAGDRGAGTGHIGVPIVWTDKGPDVCLMTGWAGADGLAPDGTALAHAQRTLTGHLGGLTQGETRLPVVVLHPGEQASSFVEGTDVPVGTATTCPSYASLLVTPPEDTTSVPLAVGLPGCSGLEIHPVVPGPTGRTGP